MRRSLAAIVALAALLLAAFAPGAPRIAHAGGEGPTVAIDGKVLSGASAVIQGEVTFVPVRAVTEALGANVRWSPEARSLEVQRGTRVVHLYLGLRQALINGQVVDLPTPPRIIEDRTYVPLRFVAESFGATVAWDAAARQVNITSPGKVAAGTFPNEPVRVVLMPVFNADAPIKKVPDPYWGMERSWQAVYLQERLEKALAGVDGMKLYPLDEVRRKVLQNAAGWEYLGHYIRGAFPGAGSKELPSDLERQLNVDCVLVTALTMSGSDKYVNALKTELRCQSDRFGLVPFTAEVKTAQAAPAQESLDALAAKWETWAKAKLMEAVAVNTAPYIGRVITDYVSLMHEPSFLDGSRAFGLLNARWLRARGDGYLNRGNKVAEGLALLQKAAAMEPEPGEGHWLLAKGYLQAHDAEAARPLLQKLDESAGPEAPPYLARARSALIRLLVGEGRGHEAARVFSRIVQSNSRPDADIYGMIYRYFLEQGKTEEARAVADAALAPSTRPPSYSRESTPARMLYLELIMAGHTSDAGLWNRLAAAAIEDKDEAEAERAYRQAIRITPQHLPTYLTVRNYMRNNSRYKEIIDLYTGALEYAAGRPDWLGHFWYGLGDAYLLTGEWELAEQSFRKAAEVDPSRVEKVETALTLVVKNRAIAESGARWMVRGWAAVPELWRTGEVVALTGRAVILPDKLIQVVVDYDRSVVVRTSEEVTGGQRYTFVGTVKGVINGVDAYLNLMTLPFIDNAKVYPVVDYDTEMKFKPSQP